VATPGDDASPQYLLGVYLSANTPQYLTFLLFYVVKLHGMTVFTARRNYASAVLGVVILSVCPSVCLSHACFWLIQRTYRRYFYTIWKANPS